MGTISRISPQILRRIQNDLTRYPFPGHFVRVQTPLFGSVPVGSMGFILGPVGRFQVKADIAFNARPWLIHDQEEGIWTVWASGGPITDLSDMAQLVPAGETITARYVKGRAIEVPVWDWWP